MSVINRLKGDVHILRDHRKRQVEERLRAGPEWRGTDDYVFSPAGASQSILTRCRRSSITAATSSESRYLTLGYTI